ncbi:MAG TPA: IgGFc-binding protein [Polyangiaceae bacterium]
MIVRQALVAFSVLGLVFAGCSAGASHGTESRASGAGTAPVAPVGSGGTDGLNVNPTGGPGSGGSGDDNNPTTCADAATNRTYIGCDFWPTVTYNPVYKEFSFAVVVANGGSSEAQVKVQRLGADVATATVPAGGLSIVKLPWVAELKGDEFDHTDLNSGARRKPSVFSKGGAYHLTSSSPVTAWQFNPLDYQQPAANCPGLPAGATNCLSVSNDASLLLPTTAMTGRYRLFGRSARLEGGQEPLTSAQGGFAITATADNTVVQVQLTAQRKVEVGTGAKIGAASLVAGTGVTAAMPGDTVTYMMNAGDVVELMGTWGNFEPEPHGDLSGSVLNSDKPVQVIALNPILTCVPTAADGNPDHIEETVLPAEVIGNSYIVAPPTGPDMRIPGHMVRFFGNVDGTTLMYADGKPAGAPDTLDAGQVVEIGPVTDAFSVAASQPFAVASIMLGGTKQDPGGTRGDPSLTMEVTPQQFRKQYTFLAPTSYLENYADILLPAGASAMLDGKPLTGTATPIGTGGWSVVREKLGAGAQNGAHRLEGSAKIGLQVMGFGLATSYSYPGGLDLALISVPPEIVVK